MDWAREKWKFGVGSKFIRQGEKNAVKYLSLNLAAVKYIGIYGIVLSTIVALGVIEIPWLLQNIFTVMYDTSLFKDYFKMFVSWIIATVFSCVIIAVLTYKVTFSGWGAFRSAWARARP